MEIKVCGYIETLVFFFPGGLGSLAKVSSLCFEDWNLFLKSSCYILSDIMPSKC